MLIPDAEILRFLSGQLREGRMGPGVMLLAVG
jgi:hypothetical protein